MAVTKETRSSREQERILTGDAFYLSDEEKQERAFRSVGNFKKMIPGLTSFARTLTRNPELVLELTTGVPRTDGKTIWLRPPITLGDRIEHDRKSCGVRDEVTLKLACPACHRLDQVTSTLIHEIAHIVMDSFESVRDADRRELVAKAVAERASGSESRAAKLTKRIEALPSNSTYIQVAHEISPFMKPIINALEDARVNRAMYQARTGTLAMFRAKAIEVFENGVEQDDGSVIKWREAPANAQMIVGLYAKAAGFDYTGWFKPEIEAALGDPELAREIAGLVNARTVASVYRMAFPVLEHLRRLGYCKRDDDPEDEPVGDPSPPQPQPPRPERDRDEDDDEGESGRDSDDGDEQDESDEQDDDSATGTPGDEADDDDTEDGDDAEGEGDGEGGYGDDDEDGDESDDDEDGDGAAADDEDGDESDEGTETDGAGMSTGETDESPTDEDGDGPGQPGDDTGESGDDSGDGDSEGDADDEGEGSEGDADETEKMLNHFNGHDDSDKRSPEYEADQAEVNRAIIQSDHFDTPSRNVFGLNVHRPEAPIIAPNGLDRTALLGWNPSRSVTTDIDCPESLLNKSLMKMRLVFAANRKSKPATHKKSGKVTAKHLYKVSMGDDRVFSRTRQPGKRDYFVVVSLDISGSTGSALAYTRDKKNRMLRIDLIKQAALAQAELLHRTGVKFAVYAHTGLNHEPLVSGGRPAAGGSSTMDVDIFVIKDVKDAWDNAARDRLRALTPAAYNLDGHVMEFLRKTAERSTATDRLILYYTDGSMPLENREEELPILQREIKTCRQKGITLVGVGVGCDDPVKHGLDTVRIDGIEDLPKLVGELESRLTK